jgi:ribosome-binding factor A
MRGNKSAEPNNVLLQRKLAEILLRESKDPRFRLVTISRVEAARDNSFATVYVSFFPSEQVEEVVTSLNHAAGFFSRCLSKVLQTRLTPKLRFLYDAGFDYSMEIDQALQKVKKTDRAEDSEH